MRFDALARVDKLIKKLELGRSVTAKEAVLLYNFEYFLKGTVADHQYKYDETSPAVFRKWVSKLRLRRRFPNYDDHDIVHDRGMYPAFQEKALQSISTTDIVWAEKRASKNQNKLAGWYLRSLAGIAGVFGPDRQYGNEIINRFYEMMLTRKPGT